MSIVRVEEEIQLSKYLVITQEIDPETLVTTNVVISDNRLNKINLLAIERGPQGNTGAAGPKGEPGKDGLIFDKLPITSGGTNNTTFSSGNIIYYDGDKLSSSNYSIQNILDAAGTNASVTGVLNGSGLYRSSSGKTVTLGIDAGEGLFINDANQIAVDDTIVRRVELDLGGIQGMVPISKGGTNNSTFTGNRLLYYDGEKISSFPLNTGTILLSGTKIDIVAGSGLTGGGSLNLPNGSVVLDITGSADILVTSDAISLSSTGVPGTYSKVTTDAKGRVVSGGSLSSADILAILGYTPWHPGNDGSGSGLDADLLDGFSSSVFLDLSTHTGTISNSNLPIQTTAGTYTKVQVNDRGIVINGQDNTYNDIVTALGYRPVSISGDTMYGPLTINGDVNLNSDNLIVRDNIPVFGTNSASILPSEPRGFSFIYGGSTQRTGILAYYPAQQELRLVTNITADPASVDGGGAGSAFMDDINGGDQNSVYLMGNLNGDPNIVLFRGVADNIYISRLNPQVVSGVKRFADGIIVNGQVSIIPNNGQTDPPLNVGANANMVVNLNSDLLHGQPGTYYTNAFNMTGLFDYTKVEFNSLEGDLGYIPRFDERTSNPSRTISNSYVRQTGNVIQVTSDANVAIGSTNTGINNANRSLVVGVNNKVYTDNGLVVGNNNIVSGNNSIALNVGSKALKPTSIAAGNYGYTWANNQLSFGAFSETDSTNSSSAQGQFSTIALYLNGTETNGSWFTMSPSIAIPKNKTLAYSLEVLLNKAAGTGAALFSFSSGIIKNSTFRDPNNITSILNITSVLKNSTKQEIYNDSQQRTHYFHYKLDNDVQIQNVKVSNPPLQYLPVLAQNTESLYKYTPEYLNLLGSYTKTNSGNVLLNLQKPLSNGWFSQNIGNPNLFIRSYNHALVTGCSVNLNMLTANVRKPLTKPYKVLSIIDKHNFTVAEHSWKGYFLTNDFFVLDPKEVEETDRISSIRISGNIYTGGNTLSYTSTNPVGSVYPGMLITFGPDQNNYPADLAQTGKVISVDSNIITFTPNFTGVFDGFSIYSLGFCSTTNHSRYTFDSSPTIQFNLGNYGYESVNNVSGSIDTTYCGLPTVGVVVSGLTASFSGQQASISPASTNSGTLTLIPRRNYTTTYNRFPTVFNRQEGIYTQYTSVNGSSKISLFDKNLDPIELPSTPFSYSLVCGEGSDDNRNFSIQNDYLISAGSFDYESKSSYKIRVRSTDMSGKRTEKSFNINVLDYTEPPPTTTTTTTTKAPPIIGTNTANFNSCAIWNGVTGNVTTVGTNGGPSAYGTYDQNGNIFQWTDKDGTDTTSSRNIYGGFAKYSSVYMMRSNFMVSHTSSFKTAEIGFRVASLTNPFSFDNFVLVGDANNQPSVVDGSSMGDVGYSYYIQKYPVTNEEYVAFLNAIASTDSYGLYSTDMASSIGGITRSGTVGSYTYSIRTGSQSSDYAKKPVNWVSWLDCARYCNWLHNNKPNGAQDSTTTEDGSYALNGITSGVVSVKSGAKYKIPTDNEWFKAAYYKSGSSNAGYWNYATQSDLRPTCIASNSLGDGPYTSVATTTTTTTTTTTSTTTPSPTTTTTTTTAAPGFTNVDDYIRLSNQTIREDLPNGTIIGKLSTLGGYSPYLEFSTASNSFSGVLVSGSNVISECNPFYKTYSNTISSTSVSVYGTPYSLVTGLTIYTSHTGLPSADILGVVEPININGFTEYSGYIISGCSPSPVGSIFSGMKLYSSLSGWNPNSRVQSLTADSITINLPFTGTQTSPIPISVSTIGRSFILNTSFTKSGIHDTIVTYSGTTPGSGNYYPSGLQYSSVTEKSGYCPADVTRSYVHGFSTQTNQYSFVTGHYLTGVVYFYSNTGTSQISVSLPENLYLEADESSSYLNFISSNTGSIPLDDNYRQITALSDTSFEVQNSYWYPDKAPNSTGTVLLSIDRNHGFQILDSKILNQIPVQFIDAPFNNTNRIPKNNLFDILSISGNKISIRDSQNYLLTETNKPKYFEKPIQGKYTILNLFNFSGTIFHNYNRIFNISKSDITYYLKKNSVIGTNSSLSYNSNHIFPISIIRIDEPFSFGVKIVPGSNIAKYCGASLWETQIFSGVNLYSTNSLINSNGSTIVGHVVNPTLRSVLLDKVTFDSPQLSYDFSASSTPNTGTDYTKNYIVSGCNDGFLSLSGYCYFYTVSGLGSGNYPKTITFAPLTEGGADRTASETLTMIPSQATIKLSNLGSSTSTIFNTTSLLPTSITNSHNGSALNSSPPYPFSTENTKPYSSGMKIPVSINVAVDYQDILEIKATSGSVTHVVPSLDSSNQIVYSTGTYPIYCFFDLKNIQTTNIIPDKSIILENNTPNLYSTETSLVVNVKPKIFLNNKTCITNGYNGLKKTNSYFYNGDSIYIDSLSLPRSYLNPNDQLTILSYNGNSSFGSGVSRNIRITRSNARDTAFSGIGINGNNNVVFNTFASDWYNQYRFTNPLGLTLDQPIPETGYISFIGSVSGNCSIPFNNNIYYHSHGGFTASWPEDPSGINVPSPQTGIYTIGVNSQNCSSGTLCVRISVYNDDQFRNIPDIVNRQDVGKQSNTATTSNGSGYVRPWGVNKKFYFDFTDDAPEINGIYYIADRLDSDTFTINMPFDADYLGRSGLVYIIDSDYNIKSNRNPNLNNVFETSQGNISLGSTNLVDYYINSYNDQSHRWKHLIHFNKDINNFGGYSGTIHGQAGTQLISLPPDLLKISQIEYMFNDELTYTTITDNSLSIPSTKNQIYLKLTVSDGAGKWSENLYRSAPRVNIYGFGSYNVDFANILYNSSTKKWTIPVVVSDITQYVNNKIIKISVSDESGTTSSNISMTTKVLPKISYAGTSSTYKNSTVNWVLPFDIKNLSSYTQNYTLVANGYPGSSYSIFPEQMEDVYGNQVLTGPAGSTTGIFNPVFQVIDSVTSEILASQSGQVLILDTNQAKPAYSINPQTFDNDIYIDITDISTTPSFSFYVPAVLDPQSNPTVTFTNAQPLSISSNIEYITTSQRYKVTASISGSGGYYPSINANIAISQPVIALDDSISWVRHTKNQPFNLTLYKKIAVNKSELIEPLVYDPEEPWALQFKIQNGVGSHRSDLPPKIKLSNLPTIGTYITQPLEYLLFTKYDEINHLWLVSVDGKKDIFGKETDVLGYRDIQIYAEDGFSSHTNTIRLFFTKEQYLDNIRSIIYATPNYAYQSNIDIKQASPPPEDPPSVSIAASPLTENTIQLTKPYAKYDKDLSVWEYAYSGAPITAKWDVSIDVTSQNTSLGDSSFSQVLVNCKGIATDKIYGVGKLNLVELDSSYLASIGGATVPFQIVDVSDPYYDAREGFPWEISFGTIGGLENPNYPPTILLSGLPSSCSGYNPKISIEDQAACFIGRSWNPAKKKWLFSFSGLPLCNISGPKPIIITAIDTDTTQNLYLSSDKKQAVILYKSLVDQGINHPGPTIKTMPGSSDTIELSPLCGQAPINNYWQFYTNIRTQCPEPTGISGWTVSGSLPPGLNYTISFPGGTPSAPWNNLGTGTLRIYGEPLTFASGAAYPDIFTFKVFDARNKSATKEIKFTDTSTANPASPINLMVYFDGTKPAYTPRGNDIGSTQQPSGTNPIDADAQQNYWPPPISSALTCTSILPHSNCQTSSFRYSGGNFAAANYNVYIDNITNTKLTNTVGSLVYIEFDNNPSQQFNNAYIIKQSGNPSVKYITVPGHTFSVGSGRFVQSAIKSIKTSNLNNFQGTVDSSTNKSILGCGTIKLRSTYDPTNYGLFGRMRPSFIASIPTSGSFRNDDIFFTGLNISTIPEYSSYPSIYTMKTSNCWETGYIRISGVSVPRPSVELFAPPPAQGGDNVPFSYNNQAYALLSKCAYGSSQYEKDLTENYRSVSINYLIKHCISGTSLNSGSASTSAAGTAGGSPIQFNYIFNSGTVLSLFIDKPSDKFPTYKYNAIPYAENEYFWVHKGGNRDDNPTQSSFPPILITGIKNSISCMSGQAISGYSVRAIGGYIPFSGGSQKVPFYQLPDNTVWSLADYLPSFTGVLQKKLNDKILIGTYQHSGFFGGTTNQKINISLPLNATSVFKPNDSVLINFSGDYISFNTGLILNDSYSSTMTLPYQYNGTSTVGTVTVYDKCYIQSVDQSAGVTSLLIHHNDIPYKTGDYIDITDGGSISTENNIILSNYRISIVSGDSSSLMASFNGPDTFTFGPLNSIDFYDIKQNYYNQIKLNNISFSQNGEWRFSLSGTPTGLYKDYKYKIFSLENSGLPAFSGTSLTPKKYIVEYPVYINKPLKIVLPQSVINAGTGIMNTNGSWSINFEIDGGTRPVYNNTPEILVNDSMCIFSRYLNSAKMNDNYNSTTDRLSITLSSANSVNYDWRAMQSFDIKISDDTGSDTVTVNLNQP